MPEMTLGEVRALLEFIEENLRRVVERSGGTGEAPMGTALRLARERLPASETVAEDLAILNAAEDPKVLVALLKCWKAGLWTLVEHHMAEPEVRWKARAGEVSAEGPTRDAAILALAEALEVSAE